MTNTACTAPDDEGLVAFPEPLSLPPFPLATMDGAAAGRRLKTAMRGYVARLTRHLEASSWKTLHTEALLEAAATALARMSEEAAAQHRAKIRRRAALDAKMKFGRALRPPRYQIAGAAGLGKTQAAIAIYRCNPALWARHGAYFAPTNNLGRAVVDDLNRNAPPGMPPARLIVGRTYVDSFNPVAACQRAEIVAAAERMVPSIYKSFCNDGQGNRCKFYDSCKYIADRKDQTPGMRVMAHAALTLTQVDELRNL